MQLRVSSLEFMKKYLPAFAGKTCTPFVNVKAFFESSFRYLPLDQMMRMLRLFQDTMSSQIQYVDNNSTVSNIVCSRLSTTII